MISVNHYTTDQRKILFSFFKENIHESFSVKQLELILGNEGISRSAIYRNIALLEDEGVLCRVANDKNRETLYQYIDPDKCSGVIHLKCDRCTATHHLNKYASEMISGLALENFGFIVNTQKAVIYGLCENCSQIQNKK